LPARWLVRNRFDNLAKLPHCPGPVVIAHGDRDELMPYWMAQKLYEVAPDPKRFLLMERCGHNDALPVSFYTGLAEFLKQAAPLPDIAAR
jgi:hypothetical protein